MQISEFFAQDDSRKAVLSQDKYHYICRLYDITHSGILREYDTVLIADRTQQYAEDCCENFVNYVGSFNIR